MPSNSKPSAKRGRPAFIPPRPAIKPTKSKATTPGRKSPPTKGSLEGDENEDDDDDDDAELLSSLSSDASTLAEPNHASATDRVGTQDPPPTIPPALLTRLLHHGFQDQKMRIGKEANGVVGKYVETFVREAIARAAFERSEAGRTGIDGSFLEVSRLYILLDDLCILKAQAG